MGFTGRLLAWKRKVLLLLCIVVSIAVLVPALYVFSRSKTMLVQETKDNAEQIAQSIAIFLQQDQGQYASLVNADSLVPGSREEAYYHRMNDMLQAIKAKTDATFIYTMSMVDMHSARYVLDAEQSSSKLFSPFGSSDAMNPIELTVFQTGKPMVTDVEIDPIWGAFLTAYVPIRGSDGSSMLGVVGVDYSAAFLQQRIGQMRWVLILGFSVLTILFTFILYIVTLAILGKAGMDDLTSLGNKRAFNHALTQLDDDARRHDCPFVLCMLDVDTFKIINDVHGHLTGDKVLSQIAKTLTECVDWPKGCFRYGGDEFAILLPSTSLAHAELVRNEIKVKVEQITLAELDDKKLSVSIGMAQWQRTLSIEELISQADQDLYEQKRALWSNLKSTPLIRNQQ
jgi:diguanylate cyclase (GGDEF)-like protein